jgi:hypothetical protein
MKIFWLHISYILIICLFFSARLHAQWNIGLTIGGLAVHQQKAGNPDFYPWKLDKKGYAVVFSGLNLSLSYRINDFWGIKAVQTLIFHDSGGRFAGISHVGVQFHDDLLDMRWLDHHMSMSIGPFWYYRKNWSKIPGYRHDPGFMKMDERGVWERKFVWYGGFFRYEYRLDKTNDLAIDFLPGYPYVYAVTGGAGKRF